MHVRPARMGETPQPVQPAQTLRERPHATPFCHQVFRIDVRADLQGLGRHHDEMPPARRVRGTARGRHSLFSGSSMRVRTSRRFAFTHESCEQQHLRFRQALAPRSVRRFLALSSGCFRTRGMQREPAPR